MSDNGPASWILIGVISFRNQTVLRISSGSQSYFVHDIFIAHVDKLIVRFFYILKARRYEADTAL